MLEPVFRNLKGPEINIFQSLTFIKC